MTTVAIVGMAGRFPGAPDVETLWANVLAGAVAIRPMTAAERLSAADGGALADVIAPIADPEWFDADFFGMSSEEAEITDPQHRLFLQSCWEAIEAAGHDPRRPPGTVGVVAGCAFPSYLVGHVLPRGDLIGKHGLLAVAVGADRDALASRVSYKLDLRGPAMTVQTFSSTALVAVHLARQSLLSHEADMMLAGAAAVRFPQGMAYPGVASPDGSSWCFDARARGTVIGNAIALVVLRRLSDAQRDGDHIWAVIEGSAVNNDGAGRPSFIAPGLAGKAGVVAEAMSNAAVTADDLDYIEGQGIATVPGDSLEIAALSLALRRRSASAGPCRLGALTANIGHAECASGGAGLIKTAFMLDRRMLPPQPGYQTPNRTLADNGQRLTVCAETAEPWAAPAGGRPRRAGVNSFGIGGVNAHVVLREAPARPPRGAAELAGPHLLVLSARSEDALTAQAERLRRHLSERPEIELCDVAYTLQAGRTAFRYRLALLAADHGDALAALAAPGSIARTRAGAPRVTLRCDEPWLVTALAELVPSAQVSSDSRPDSRIDSRVDSRVDKAAVELDGGPPVLLPAGVDPRRWWPPYLAGLLWETGAEVSWPTLHAGRPRERVSLPTYPFETRRYWLDPVMGRPRSFAG